MRLRSAGSRTNGRGCHGPVSWSEGRRGGRQGCWSGFSTAGGSEEQPDSEDRERDASHGPSEWMPPHDTPSSTAD